MIQNKSYKSIISISSVFINQTNNPLYERIKSDIENIETQINIKNIEDQLKITLNIDNIDFFTINQYIDSTNHKIIQLEKWIKNINLNDTISINILKEQCKHIAKIQTIIKTYIHSKNYNN